MLSGTRASSFGCRSVKGDYTVLCTSAPILVIFITVTVAIKAVLLDSELLYCLHTIRMCCSVYIVGLDLINLFSLRNVMKATIYHINVFNCLHLTDQKDKRTFIS